MTYGQVARARTAVKLAKEKLDSLIDLFRKKLGVRNLEFMNVSGITNLIEVGCFFFHLKFSKF